MTRLSPLLLVLAAACIDSSSARDAAATTAADTSEDGDAPDTTPPEPCDAPGETRCDASETAVELCRDSVWQTTGCGAGRICVDVGGAQCLEASGDDTCRDMLYCYLACGSTGGGGSPCELDCYLGGTVLAQGQLAAFVGCMDRASCDGLGSADGTFACISEHCGTPLAQCYFPTSGGQTCGKIFACREACDLDPDPEACGLACGNDATLDAQADYGVLELCLFYACAEATSEVEQVQCFEEVTGLNGACSPYVRACANPLGD